MATRSTIAMVLPNGTIQSIYCHWDGYLEGVGQTLAEHYSKRKTIQLLANGDVSSLGDFVGHKHDFDRSTKVKSTTFYGRDRGETDTESRNHANVEEWLRFRGEDAEFFYLLQGKEWWYRDCYDVKELTPIVIGLLTKD
jgi:hypothetical protein